MIRRNNDRSRAVSSHIEIPVPDGLMLRPFQKAAVEYALAHPDTLIGDPPGAGKTAMAVSAMNLFPGSERILIICPAFLKPHWKKEFERWSTRNLKIEIIQGTKQDWPETNVFVINYEVLKYYRKELRSINWHYIIIDEIHKIKSGRADRTKEVFGGIKRNDSKKIIDRISPIPAERRLFLTGTPSLNGKPKELWPILKAVDPEGLGKDWFTFAKRYCQLQEITRFNPTKGKQEHIGWVWEGRDNLEELQEKMRSKFLIRRTKKEIMPELPEKTRIIIPITPKGKLKKLIKEEIQAFEQYTKDRKDALIETPVFGEISRNMLKIGLAMVEPTIELAESDLESMDKLIIMCYHQMVVEQIADHFGKQAIMIHGDVLAGKRQALVDQFQMDPAIRVAVGTIGAMGVGFTMTAAYETIFPERSWVPGECTQAEDRNHRYGMQDKAIYKHLVLEGSLAERQVRVLIEKQESADKMLDKQI